MEIDDVVARVKATMNSVGADEALLVYADGRIEVMPQRLAERPEGAAGPHPIARFPAAKNTMPEEEIRDLIATGLSNAGSGPPRQGAT